MLKLAIRHGTCVLCGTRSTKSRDVCVVPFQNGWSPLLVASEHGHLDILKILLQHHARVDVFDEVSAHVTFSRDFLT